MHFLSSYIVRTEANIQKTIKTNQSAVMSKTQYKYFLHSFKSIYKEDKKRKEKHSKRTATWKDQVSKMPALHLTKSKSVRNLAAIGRGVHTCAAGKNMFPFTQDLQESGETRKQSKRQASGEKKRKSKNAKQGRQSW